jgi:hypothetical protein
VDAFLVTLLAFGVLVGALLLLGKYYPGSGAEQLQWRPTRSPEVEAENEINDLEQMLAVANRRRRRKGMPELTEASLRASVAEEQAELELAADLEAERRRKEARAKRMAAKRAREQAEQEQAPPAD